MNNKKIFGILALGVIALLGISLVAAYQGDYSVKGPNYSEDRHEAMQEAFDNSDYDAWVTLMTKDGRHPRVVDVINEDNFSTFLEAREAGKSGDVQKATELRAQLGLNNGMGPKDGTGARRGSGQGSGRGSGMKGQGNNGECQYN